MSLVDRAIFVSPVLKVGIFRCPPDDARFRDSGPAEHHLVVFPRTSVWIRHEGGRPFVADPGVATTYNRGQPYSRSALSRDGDRCDWFALEPPALPALARHTGGRIAEDPERPFTTEFVGVPPRLYAAQRRVLHAVAAAADPLEVEERALAVVAAVLAPSAGAPTPAATGTAGSHRELAMAARAELARDLFAPLDLATLAARLAVSPWHLCRVFREQCGTTLHAMRRDLRLRAALEHLGPEAAGMLSRLAHACGFSSHSHFTAAFRRQFGVPPSLGLGPAGREPPDCPNDRWATAPAAVTELLAH